MNRMMSPGGGGDLLQHGLQPLLELAADLAPAMSAPRSSAISFWLAQAPSARRH